LDLAGFWNETVFYWWSLTLRGGRLWLAALSRTFWNGKQLSTTIDQIRHGELVRLLRELFPELGSSGEYGVLNQVQIAFRIKVFK
jgi:hypothetical protein